MLFRSGRFWSRTGSKVLIFSSLLATLASSSYAYVQVSLASGTPGTTIGSSFYFPAYNSPHVTIDTTATPLASSASPIDFGAQNGKIQYISGNYPTVNVTWVSTATTPPTSATGFMLVVTMTGTINGSTNGSGQVVASPPGACPGVNTGGGNSCLIGSATATVTSSDTTQASPVTDTNNYYATYAIVPNSTVQLSLDFRTMCDSFSKLNNSGTGTGCSTLIVNPAAGSPTTTLAFTQLFLTFGIYPVPTPIPVMEPIYNYASPPSAVDTSGTMTFNFSNGPAAGSFTCTLPSSYYPGDGQITVDGTAFNYTGTSSPADGLANSYLMAVNEGSGPFQQIKPTAANFLSGTDTGGTNDPYAIRAAIATLPGQVIGGFENSTSPSNQVWYGAGFIGQDYYQFLLPSTGSGCAFTSQLQTAPITTLLNASKCFIATATFRSMYSPPLVLLRAFRDQFLEHFGLGRAFVHWYYAWSPGAADWLVANPVFRFPVFLALIPLQIVAWLILHPLMFTLVLMLALSVLSYGVSLRVRRGDEEFQG